MKSQSDICLHSMRAIILHAVLSLAVSEAVLIIYTAELHGGWPDPRVGSGPENWTLVQL